MNEPPTQDKRKRFGGCAVFAVRAIGVSAGVVVAGIGVLMVVSGWSHIRQNWEAGEPWFSGFQAASLATPIAALIAAGAAITTARWGLRAELARRIVERRDTTARTLRDRFHELVKLLSADELRAREGAAYAIAALADDWATHYRNEPEKALAEQQVCVEVLISQLRDPFPDKETVIAYAQVAAFKRAIQKLISSRLGKFDGDEVLSGVWSALDLNFDGCIFHDLDLTGRALDGETVSFAGAQFIGEFVSFDGARFTGDLVSFVRTVFNADRVILSAQFTARSVLFNDSSFVGDAVFFDQAHFMGEIVSFDRASFQTNMVSFGAAHFKGGAVRFGASRVSGDTLWMAGAHFTTETASYSLELDVQNVTLDELVTTHLRGRFASFFRGVHVSSDGARFGVAPEDVPECLTCAELAVRSAAGTAA